MHVQSSSYIHHRRHGNLLINRPPQVQTGFTLVYIVAFGRVVLNHAFFQLEEHGLDLAHFLPCRSGFSLLIAWRHADMLPSAAIAGDTAERSLANHDLKHAVPAVSIASVFSALKIMLAVFAEGG